MPADHYVMDSDMKAVADAIRTKGGTTAPLVFPDGMVQAINDIQTGGDHTDEDAMVTRTITEYTNDRVTSIGRYAFHDCYSLTSAEFPQVTSIEAYAFDSCYSLTSAEFPQVTSIEVGAFYGDYMLEKLIIRTPTVCSAGSNMLLDAIKCQIYVPDNLVGQYKSATNWSKYASRIHGLSELP